MSVGGARTEVEEGVLEGKNEEEGVEGGCEGERGGWESVAPRPLSDLWGEGEGPSEDAKLKSGTFRDALGVTTRTVLGVWWEGEGI